MKHWLLTYVRTYWPGIGLFAVLSLGATGLQLASPWPMKVLIDSAIGHLPAPGPLAAYTHTQTLLAILAFGLVLIYLLHNVFDFWASAFSAKLVYKIDYAVKSQLFDHIMHLAGRSLDRKRSGDYLYRTNVETQMVSSLLVGTTVTMIGSVVMIVGVLAILWQMNSFMAVISLCMIPLLILSIRFFSSPMAEASQQVELSTSEVYGYGEESIAHVPLVQSFNHEADQLSKLQQLMARNFSDRRRSIYLGNWFGLSNDMIATLAVAALVAIGGQRVFSGQLTIGELVLFLTYITYLYGPLQSLTGAIGSVPAALAAIRRVYDVLEHEQPVPQLVSPEHVDQVRGSLQLNHVSFSYGQHQVLSDITLGIAPGQKVAIYGPSGGGKSTLLELLLRFYDVGSGSITLDGLNLREYDLADLRRQFALVDQEPVLFSGTVAENIAYGRTGPKADLDQLVAAAGAANAYDFIMTLPQAFDTPVGEGGSLLSGGQKQRIAIARAFLKNAPILLLDEPTSALDAGSEAAVVEALDRLMRGRTSIVVGHNLEVISRADVVYLMENGQLSGRTTPAELMAQSRTAVGTAGLVTAEQPSVVAEMQPAKIKLYKVSTKKPAGFPEREVGVPGLQAGGSGLARFVQVVGGVVAGEVLWQGRDLTALEIDGAVAPHVGRPTRPRLDDSASAGAVVVIDRDVGEGAVAVEQKVAVDILVELDPQVPAVTAAVFGCDLPDVSSQTHGPGALKKSFRVPHMYLEDHRADLVAESQGIEQFLA